MSSENKNEVPAITITKPSLKKKDSKKKNNNADFEIPADKNILIDLSKAEDNVKKKKSSFNENEKSQNDLLSNTEKNNLSEKTFVDYLKPPPDDREKYFDDEEIFNKRNMNSEISEESKNNYTNFENNLGKKNKEYISIVQVYYNKEIQKKKIKKLFKII